MIAIKHVDYARWRRVEKEGYRTGAYLGRKVSVEEYVDRLLLEARDMIYEYDLKDYVTAFKVVYPDSSYVCLRVDRDYFELYRKREDGSTYTICTWQMSTDLARFRLFELYYYMATICRQEKG